MVLVRTFWINHLVWLKEISHYLALMTPWSRKNVALWPYILLFLLVLTLSCLFWYCPSFPDVLSSIKRRPPMKCVHWVSERRRVNMVNRICRNCTICDAKYLVKLSNHLADVHGLDHMERRKYLQEAKLQPRVKVIAYLTSHDQVMVQKYGEHILYEPSFPKKLYQVQKKKPQRVPKRTRKIRKRV